MFNNFFFGSIGQTQMKIWLMNIAYWILEATNTLSEYVILIALHEQWLHQRASMLRYTYIACILVVPHPTVILTLYVCMYVRMYVCVYMYVCMYINEPNAATFCMPPFDLVPGRSLWIVLNTERTKKVRRSRVNTSLRDIPSSE